MSHSTLALVALERGRLGSARSHAEKAKETGQEVGAVWMPAQVSGSPMTYRIGGRQFIVIAVSGGNYSGEYIAFALPSSDINDTGGGTQQ